MQNLTPDEWLQVRDAFEAALTVPSDQRASAIASRVTPRLRAFAVRLLHSHADLTLTDDSSRSLASPLDATPYADGDRIGEYTVRRPIGRGGMGVVYLAEQQSPRRAVALKVLRSVGSSPHREQRFLLEGEALGRLHHPNIAQIHQAGVAVTRHGHCPYIAMELVTGQRLDAPPIRNLPLPARVALLAEIADAIGHAHQRGVIHRDLKPSNIFVQDGHAKVLDFGVARLINREPAAAQTGSSDLVGTVAYMSPEQVAADVDAIDTRTDIYSLGVSACELLIGRLPYPVKAAPLAEAVDLIRAGGAAALERNPPPLPIDLRLILRKTLEPRPEDRYATAADFAADLRSFLAGAAVTARPPTLGYQLRVLMRTRRALVASVASIAATLLIAAVVSTGFAFRAARASEIALAQATRATQATQRAESETRKLAAVNDFFFRDIFGSIEPGIAEQQGPTVLAALQRAAHRVAEIPEPLVRAAVHDTIANMYLALGTDPDTGASLLDDALRHAQAGLALRRERCAPDDPQLRDSIETTAQALHTLGQLTAALPLLDELIEQPEVRGNQEYCRATPFIRRANVYLEMGQVASAQADAEAALPLVSQLTDDADRTHWTAEAHFTLGRIAMQRGDVASAEDHFRAAITDNPLPRSLRQRAAVLTQLGLLLSQTDRMDAAEPYLLEGLALRQRLVPPGDGQLAQSLVTLGAAWFNAGRCDAALPLFDEGLRNYQALADGQPSVDVAKTIVWRANALDRLGRFEDELADLVAAQPIYEALPEIDQLLLGECHLYRARALKKLGRDDAARAAFLEAEAVFQRNDPAPPRQQMLAAYRQAIFGPPLE